MSVTTFEAVIENGQIRLPAGVVLPERKIVCIIVPGNDRPRSNAPKRASDWRTRRTPRSLK